jgi:hypothetical protein
LTSVDLREIPFAACAPLRKRSEMKSASDHSPARLPKSSSG